ncbi:MAG: hypothetical protein BGP24_00575 [Lysobacterales bacterium 69-70]|nr:MAG: hypothetical protein ABS97_02395 [Xanthomonadaceae bacterium SCN 69-320]ODV17896.1 MAG: hypothetical protein ABT27_15680 [Xanthomonadaceae bacterium SCN 69-25]OJY99348.1 MAG: hypothetical protein BGP24_00575 [Xanthomonadales bacterium 69-70]
MDRTDIRAARGRFLRGGLLALLLSATGVAGAVDPRMAQDSRQAFKSFAQPLVGTWDCNLRTWDDRFHERMVETVQKRRFEWVLKGNFLQETIFAVLRGGDTAHVGITLLSVDPETMHVLGSGFEATTPDRRMTLDAELAPDLRHLSGKVEITPQSENARAERLDWQWIEDGRTRSRLYSRAPNGREFLNQELICKRASEAPAGTGD